MQRVKWLLRGCEQGALCLSGGRKCITLRTSEIHEGGGGGEIVCVFQEDYAHAAYVNAISVKCLFLLS